MRYTFAFGLVLLASCNTNFKIRAKLDAKEVKSFANPADEFRFISAIRHSEPNVAIRRSEQADLHASISYSIEWRWRFRILHRELLLDSGARGFGTESSGLSPPEGVGADEARARFLSIRGYAEQRRAHWKAAQELYTQASVAGSSIPDPCWHAELLVHHLAQTLLHLGHFQLAIKALQQGPQYTEACSDGYWKGLLPLVYGNLYRAQYRFEEAADWFERCRAAAIGNDTRPLMPLALGNLALIYYQLGDGGKALGALSAADRYYKKLSNIGDQQRRDWGQDIGHRARVYASLGRYGEAVRDYQEAMRVARQTADDSYLIRWIDELTSVYISMGDLASAELLNHQVENSNTNDDSAVTASSLLNSARIARLQGHYSSAYVRLQQLERDLLLDSDPKLMWQAHIELAQTLAKMRRKKEAGSEYVAALRTAEKAREAIGSDDYRLTYFAQFVTLYQSYVEFLVDEKQDAAALQVAESAHARLLMEKLHAQPTQFRRVDFAKTAREKQAVILSYSISPGHSFLWVTTGSGSKLFTLPPKSLLENRIKQLNFSISQERDILKEPEISRFLYDQLVGQAADLIPAGANVIVIPDGALADLNFETLIPPERPAHYWLESNQITIAPSLTLLHRDKPGRKFYPKTLLLAGAAIEAGEDLGALPGSERELRSIQERFQGAARCRLMMGAEATPTRFVQEDLGTYSLIHISAHAVPNRESPLDSAVILSPDARGKSYKLYAHDFCKMRLNADLVTLSACQSAGVANIPGEGLVGLAWAVLSAGARNVIASLWKVPDRATYEVMNALYSHIYSGDFPAHALRSAKLEIIRKGGNPYDWAAFQLYSR